MGLLQYALAYALTLCLLCELVRSDTVSSQDNGKCELVTEHQVTFTTSVTHNGVLYSDVQITIDEDRGHKCRQATGASNRCEGTHTKAQTFAVHQSGTTPPESKNPFMCHPTITNDVTITVNNVHLGGGTHANVDVQWSNITECSCDKVIA